MRPGKSVTRSLGAVAVFAALASSLGLAGCGSETDDRLTTAADWSYIYPAIIEPSCATASCHSRFTARAGVDLGDSDTAWYQLNCRHFAVAGSPGQSELISLLNASGASRMPPDFALPKADIALIATWIQAGAADDVGTDLGKCP